MWVLAANNERQWDKDRTGNDEQQMGDRDARDDCHHEQLLTRWRSNRGRNNGEENKKWAQDVS
jgi:hypothetical protein